jgi:hypothetical protein
MPPAIQITMQASAVAVGWVMASALARGALPARVAREAAERRLRKSRRARASGCWRSRELIGV